MLTILSHNIESDLKLKGNLKMYEKSLGYLKVQKEFIECYERFVDIILNRLLSHVRFIPGTVQKHLLRNNLVFVK